MAGALQRIEEKELANSLFQDETLTGIGRVNGREGAAGKAIKEYDITFYSCSDICIIKIVYPLLQERRTLLKSVRKV